MANSANGAAYDTSYLATIDPMPSPFPQTVPLSTEPGRKTAPSKKTEAQMERENRARVRLFIKSVIVIGLLVTLFCGELSQRVALADVNSNVRAEQSAVTLLESENVRLKAALEAKYSDEYIEQYAVGKLGMLKLEKKILIDLSKGDRAQTDTSK